MYTTLYHRLKTHKSVILPDFFLNSLGKFSLFLVRVFCNERTTTLRSNKRILSLEPLLFVSVQGSHLVSTVFLYLKHFASTVQFVCLCSVKNFVTCMALLFLFTKAKIEVSFDKKRFKNLNIFNECCQNLRRKNFLMSFIELSKNIFDNQKRFALR